MHTTDNQPILRCTPSAMAQAHLNTNSNNTHEPEWSLHSESPESFIMPKTPSTHAVDDATLPTSLQPILKQKSSLSTDSLLTSLKSAIRRVHPDHLQRQEHEHDRVIITRASTATTTNTLTQLHDNNNNYNTSPLFSIPTIPERSLLSPSSAATSLRQVKHHHIHINKNNNVSVSSLLSNDRASMSSVALSAIPLTEDANSICNSHESSNDTLMKGRLLCAVHMEWYSRRRSATNHEASDNHIRLRQSRLRWREFEAILKVDRLELYLVTNLVIKTRRLAHVIYLDPDHKKSSSKSFRHVQLKLISPVDFIWSLQFRSYEDRNVSFLFVSRTIRESQTWYMALYRRPTIKTTPIPALIDLYIPQLDDLQIRLPLADLDFQNSNVRIQHVIHCALTLLDRQNVKPDTWHCDNVSLCWRFGKHTTRLDWIPDDGYLLTPHLIEQTHTLELRPDTQRCRQHPRDQLPPPIMEGEVMYYDTQKHYQRKLYGMMEGHLLFLLEPSKATRPPEEMPDGGRHHTRFTWARSIFTTQVLHVRSLTRMFLRPTNASVTSTARHAAQIEFNRRVANIMSALTVIDMSRATKVRRVSSEQPTTFEVNMDHGSKQLQFQATTMHSMFEWIQRIQKIIHQQHPSLPQQLQEKSVLHSGMLYVRQDYLSTFKQLYCILTREKRLVLYNTCRRRQVWNEHFITLCLDQQVYVYNANDDQATTGASRSEQKTRQPPRMFGDGLIMESSKTEDCTFVIWQTAQRHILVTLRERLSTFKFGHRLGRKGTVWVCLARNKDEKEAWVCAIHQAIDQDVS